MRQPIGIKGHQYEGYEARDVPKELPRGEENDERKSQSQQTRCQPHPKHQAPGGAIIAGVPITPRQVGFDLEFAVLQLWDPQILPGDRGCGQQFRERRVLGVQAVVAGLPHHVPGEHVIGLVKGQRLAVYHHRHMHCLECQQDTNRHPHPSR
jgi:hypothetical protein